MNSERDESLEPQEAAPPAECFLAFAGGTGTGFGSAERTLERVRRRQSDEKGQADGAR